MASFNPGTGTATLKSTTAEAAVIEIIMLLRIGELTVANNPNGVNNITCSFDVGQSMQVNGSFTFPCLETIASDGSLNILGQAYLLNMTFSPGTSGTLKSTNYCAALIELFKLMQDAQNNTTKNPNGYTYISGAPDSNGTSYNGQFTLDLGNPIITSTGSTTIAVQEYLTSL